MSNIKGKSYFRKLRIVLHSCKKKIFIHMHAMEGCIRNICSGYLWGMRIGEKEDFPLYLSVLLNFYFVAVNMHYSYE